MTNLSKELCEICGIEPHEEFWDIEGELVKILKYPNFERGENFIKLYEILNKKNRIELLRRAIQTLQIEKFYGSKNLKQAIRETEWVYG